MDGILAAFSETPIVAIGELHGWEALHDVIAALICDRRFPEVVDAIVVEFANARLQSVIDAYVGGRAVSETELASVWRESTQRSGVWDNPVYRRFFDLVRTINAGLPDESGIRLLAGDPPIDWATITAFGACNDLQPTCEDYWIQRRDQHFADVVLDEVVARDQRALLIAGMGHMLRRPGPPTEGPPSLPQLVEAASDASVTVVIPHQPFPADAAAFEARLERWPAPGLAPLPDTWLGGLPACYVDEDLVPPGQECTDDASGPTIGDLTDAYLYLGD